MVLKKYNQNYNTQVGVDINPSAGDSWGAAISPSGLHMVLVSGTLPCIAIYKRGLTEWEKLPNPDIMPSGACYEVSYSADGLYLAVASAAAPYIIIYDIDGDNYTKRPNPLVSPTGAVTSCRFGSDNNYLAVSTTATPYLIVYDIDGGTFDKLPNPSVLPTGAVHALDMSAAEDLILLSGTAFAETYTITGGVIGGKSIIPSAPSGIIYANCITRAGDYVFLGSSAGPFFAWYKKNGSSWDKLPNPTIVFNSLAYESEWSHDGKYLFVGEYGGGSPDFYAYERAGDTLTLITDFLPVQPSNLPGGIAQSPDGKELIMIVDGGLFSGYESDYTEYANIDITDNNGYLKTIQTLKRSILSAVISEGYNDITEAIKRATVGVMDLEGYIDTVTNIKISKSTIESVVGTIEIVDNNKISATNLMSAAGEHTVIDINKIALTQIVEIEGVEVSIMVYAGKLYYKPPIELIATKGDNIDIPAQLNDLNYIIKI